MCIVGRNCLKKLLPHLECNIVNIHVHVLLIFVAVFIGQEYPPYINNYYFNFFIDILLLLFLGYVAGGV